MQWHPLVPFLARTTLSEEERYMYFVLAIISPDCASWSVLLYLASSAFSSSTETCKGRDVYIAQLSIESLFLWRVLT